MEHDGRLSRDVMLMEVARLMAKRSTCRRLKVGAVLSLEGRVVSSGYVGAPAGVEHCNPDICNESQPCVRTIHAEQNAIAWAARVGMATLGSTLYTTVSPCIECAKLLINAGVERIVYYETYRDQSPILLLRSVGISVEAFKEDL